MNIEQFFKAPITSSESAHFEIIFSNLMVRVLKQDWLYKVMRGVVPVINADEFLIPQPHSYQE